MKKYEKKNNLKLIKRIIAKENKDKKIVIY